MTNALETLLARQGVNAQPSQPALQFISFESFTSKATTATLPTARGSRFSSPDCKATITSSTRRHPSIQMLHTSEHIPMTVEECSSLPVAVQTFRIEDNQHQPHFPMHQARPSPRRCSVQRHPAKRAKYALPERAECAAKFKSGYPSFATPLMTN